MYNSAAGSTKSDLIRLILLVDAWEEDRGERFQVMVEES